MSTFIGLKVLKNSCNSTPFRVLLHGQQGSARATFSDIFSFSRFPIGGAILKTRDIQEAAQQLQADLGLHSRALTRAVPSFGSRYPRLLTLYSKPFAVRRLRTDAAFVVRPPRQLVFNASGFQLFHAPINASEAAGELTSELADIARQIATEQLVVHELDHVTTGLIQFSDVQHLKAIAGLNVLGEMDLVADARAAQICARLEMFRAQERGKANYASRLQQQLLVMGTYAFPAFQAPAGKMHKRQRFLGLAMMAARVSGYLWNDCRLDEGELPIDTPIYPYVDLTGRILLCAFNPDRMLLGNAVDVDARLLKQTCDELDSVTFARSVARAGRLLEQVGPVAGPVANQLIANPEVRVGTGTL